MRVECVVAMLRRTAPWVLGLSLLLVAAGSFMPMDSLPQSSLSDKFQHVLGYGWLGGWSVLSVRRLRARMLVVAGCFLWGGVIEVLQPIYFGRSGEVLDLIANTMGLMLGGLVTALVLIWLDGSQQNHIKDT